MTDGVRPGRKRDHSRDLEILDAALEVLAETGYERMTMDMVAARAKAGKATVYRRWPSKAQMVVDAVERMSQREIDLADLPDTGTLRGDLVGLIRPEAFKHSERRLKVMAGVATMLATQGNHDLVDAASIGGAQPWVLANRIMIERAIARREISSSTDVDLMAHVIPSMCYYRVCVQGRTLDLDYLRALVDGLLVPAVTAPLTRRETAHVHSVGASQTFPGQ